MTESVNPSAQDVHSDLEDFAQQIADQVQSFLLALRAPGAGEALGGCDAAGRVARPERSTAPRRAAVLKGCWVMVPGYA